MTSILVCTLGGSWAVIPEVYAFLAPERLPLYRDHPQRDELSGLCAHYALSAPNEIWVCTTCGFTGEGPEPDVCPICGAKHEKFRKF